MGTKTRYPGVTRLGEGRYVVRVQIKCCPRTGQRKEAKRIVTCRNVEDAARMRGEMKLELLADAEPTRKRVTLKTYARWWLESRALRLARSTGERYANALDMHILPKLGPIYLDALARKDIEQWIAKKSKRYQPGTVNGWVCVLKTVLADACAEHGLPNPSARVQALPVYRPEADPNALTEDELRALVEAFKRDQPHHYPLILTLAVTGLRWGEASALKWEDLDREAGIIRVRRAHWHGEVKVTKTRRPRTAPLPKLLLDVLDEWRAELVRQQHPGLQAGWCFPGRTGALRFSSSMTKVMKRGLKAAGITKRVNIQGLRRSAEDTLRRLGVAGPVAEALMGHGPRMRSHYSTVADSEVANVGARIVDAIGLRQGKK